MCCRKWFNSHRTTFSWSRRGICDSCKQVVKILLSHSFYLIVLHFILSTSQNIYIDHINTWGLFSNDLISVKKGYTSSEPVLLGMELSKCGSLYKDLEFPCAVLLFQVFWMLNVFFLIWKLKFIVINETSISCESLGDLVQHQLKVVRLTVSSLFLELDNLLKDSLRTI